MLIHAIAACVFSMFVLAVFAVWQIYRRKMHIWLPGYCRRSITRMTTSSSLEGPIHILFCLVDHFEPGNGGVGRDVWQKRVDAWRGQYPRIADQFVDADGYHPRHTWFYPPHYYSEELLAKIVELCRLGYGEVELHLHHNRMPPFPDSEETLRAKLRQCIAEYSRLGVFSTVVNGQPALRYAFIHGDWALNNSRNDPSFCGIDNEISILLETGCYADLTFPAFLMESQPRIVSSIYYAHGSGEIGKKAYDRGRLAQVGITDQDGLLMIQGPLGILWDERKWLLFPRIEDGDVSSHHLPTPGRVDRWVRTAIHVKDRPEWVIVKIHTHGAPESEHQVLLNRPVEEMHRYLGNKYNDGVQYKLHYVTARELYNIVKAAENSENGDPGKYRDYLLGRYSYV